MLTVIFVFLENARLLFFFLRLPKGGINTNITEGTQSGRLDPAATPPAEASGVSGAVPTVRKEEGEVFMRDRVGLVRSGRGISRRKHKVMEAVH